MEASEFITIEAWGEADGKSNLHRTGKGCRKKKPKVIFSPEIGKTSHTSKTSDVIIDVGIPEELPNACNNGEEDGTLVNVPSILAISDPKQDEDSDSSIDPLDFQEIHEVDTLDDQNSKLLDASDIFREELGLVKTSGKIIVDKEDPCSRFHFIKYYKKPDQTRVRVYECGLCGKEFGHRYTLMRHLPIHTDERNFQCNTCGKAFRQLSTLAQHKATHIKLKPFVCEICQQKFTRISTLMNHKRRHTEEKQYKCDMCNRAFFQKGNLKNHMFTHTNARPYKCDICGKGFNQLTNARTHKEKQHNSTSTKSVSNRPFKCSKCPASFKKKLQLRQHDSNRHTKTDKSTAANSRKVFRLRNKRIGNIRILRMGNSKERMESEDDPDSPKPVREEQEGILIDPIDSKAMHRVQSKGDVPFAVLKSSSGASVVVKVKLTEEMSHMLTPVCAADMEQYTVFDTLTRNTSKAVVKLKVPVVATINMRLDSTGQVTYDAQSTEDETLENLSVDFKRLMSEPNKGKSLVPSEVTCSLDESSKTFEQKILFNNPKLEESWDASGSIEEDEPLIHLEEAAPEWDAFPPSHHVLSVDSNIVEATISEPPTAQFKIDCDLPMHQLKPTGVLNEYEVVRSDADYVLPPCPEEKNLLEDGTTFSVDSSQMAALVEALRNAGCEFPIEGISPPQIVIDPGFITNDELGISKDETEET